MPLRLKDLYDFELLLPGHAACPGCPAAIGLRILGKALGPRTVLVVPACCTSIIQGVYPRTSVRIPLLNIAFAASAATASGIAAGFEAQGMGNVNVVVWAGDGGTVDIGIQALSGAAERGDNVIYVCYDNEAYMNTGIQRSGSTPYGAWTTTTWTGKKEPKKFMPWIVAAHNVPYVATAVVSYPLDFAEKLRKAASIKGFKYIHLLAPCPVGWRFSPELTVEVGKLAVATGMWPLFEIEHGRFKLSPPSLRCLDKSRRLPVERYLRVQGRFKHLTDEDVKRIQEYVDEMWEVIADMVKRGRVF